MANTSRNIPSNLTILSFKNFLVLCISVALILLPKDNYSIQPEPNPYKLKTVVIDAGHGGHDPGAISPNKTREKDVALAVALKVGQYIEKNFPDVNVVYTRKTDVFVELHERAAIANRNNADLFISIHCNTFDSGAAHGTEVYVLGLHRTQDNLDVAKRENSVILMEDDYNKQYNGFDPNSAESYVMLSMLQNAYISQSNKFAIMVDDQFKNRVNRSSRGVKQAGFLVLVKTAMPSTLIELGFISNKSEENFLTSDQGQVYMASAIYRAFKDYKTDIEHKEPAPINVSEDTNKPVQEETVPPPTPEPVPKPEPKPVVADTKPAVEFRVQFLASDIELPDNDPRLKKVEGYQMEHIGGWYKYMSSSFTDYDLAASHQAALKKMGFTGAFMVSYINGERKTVKEGLAAQKK